jgi:hypothetical protein
MSQRVVEIGVCEKAITVWLEFAYSILQHHTFLEIVERIGNQMVSNRPRGYFSIQDCSTPKSPTTKPEKVLRYIYV